MASMMTCSTDVCFCSGGPMKDATQDPHFQYRNQWKTDMLGAPCAEPAGCCYAYCFPCCAQYSLRKQILGGDMSQYQFADGMCHPQSDDDCCVKTCCGPCRMCNSACPNLCLCFEAACCFPTAVLVSRYKIMDAFDIQSDPCDRRIIRFTNCVAWCSCLCFCAACLTRNRVFLKCGRILNHVARCLCTLTIGCATAQAFHELGGCTLCGGDGNQLLAPQPPPQQTMGEGYQPPMAPAPQQQAYPPQQQYAQPGTPVANGVYPNLAQGEPPAYGSATNQ